MNLRKTFYDQLQRAPCNQPVEILSSDEKLRVEVRLKDCDRIGCLFDRVDIRNIQDVPMTTDPFQITRRITYLVEPLEVIESEGIEGKTIIRSNPPRVEGKIITFFELVLEPFRGLSLVRQKYDDGKGERTPIPVPMTRDTLERLICDLIDLSREGWITN